MCEVKNIAKNHETIESVIMFPEEHFLHLLEALSSASPLAGAATLLLRLEMFLKVSLNLFKHIHPINDTEAQ